MYMIDVFLVNYFNKYFYNNLIQVISPIGPISQTNSNLFASFFDSNHDKVGLMNQECGGHKHSGWLPLLEVFLKIQ